MSVRQVRRLLMTVDAIGGVWRYSMDVARSLSLRGIEVVFASLGPAPSATQRLEAEAIGPLFALDAPLDWMVDSPDQLARVPALLSDLAAKAGVDLLHLNLPSQAVGLECDLPIVVVAHSCVVTWFRAVRNTAVPEAWEWQRGTNLYGLNAADVAIAPSRSFAAALRNVYGPLPHLRVVHNGARPGRAAWPKQPCVLAAGRWWDQGKNALTLDAAARDCDWPVRMAGASHGPQGQSQAIVCAEHLGELAHDRLQDLVATAAIFCSPSIYEPFGLAPLEAAGSGAALVLSDIPTYRELWDGAALFADPLDASGFARAINTLASDSDLRNQLGRRAAERAAQFTLDAQAEGLLSAYADAMDVPAADHRRRA